MAGTRRILVTGANGQVGRELLVSLAGVGEIVPCVRESHQAEFPEARVVDLADGEQLRATVHEVQPAVIVNAAAYTAVDAAETNQQAADAANHLAPAMLAAECARSGAALLHFSTDYVFDGSGNRPWREDDPCRPLNEYGRSKLAGEQAVRASGAAHVVIRTSWVYGVEGNNFVRKMIELGRTRGELTVVDDQVGAPTSARFLAEVAAALIRGTDDDLRGRLAASRGLVHAACAGETSWCGFATEIFNQVRALRLNLPTPQLRPIASEAFATAAARPKNSRLATDRLRELRLIEIPTWQDELARNLPTLVARLPAS